jgi:hypothetical protein
MHFMSVWQVLCVGLRLEKCWATMLAALPLAGEGSTAKQPPPARRLLMHCDCADFKSLLCAAPDFCHPLRARRLGSGLGAVRTDSSSVRELGR